MAALQYPQSVMTERRRIRVDDFKPRDQPAPAPADEAPSDCACPRLEPDDWHNVENDWTDIAFVRGNTNAVLGVPVGYDTAKSALGAKAAKLGLTVPDDAMLLLGAGKFRRPIMLEVEGARPGARDVFFPGGIAHTWLVDAPWGDMQRVVDEAREAATERHGRKPDDLWIWYLTCRQCSRERNFETLVIAHYRE